MAHWAHHGPLCSPEHTVLVLWQHAHRLHRLVAKDDGQAVDAWAGHARRQTLAEDAQPLVGPEHAYCLRNGAPVHLNPRADQVQRVGQNRRRAAGENGGDALQRGVRQHAGEVQAGLLLIELVAAPPRGAARHVVAQAGHVSTIETAAAVTEIDCPEVKFNKKGQTDQELALNRKYINYFWETW